jgi:Ca-activated chloride channel homolog
MPFSRLGEHISGVPGFWRLRMNPMMSLRFLTLFLPALLAAPQVPAPRPQSVKVDVDLVLVDAAVTDRSGRSVTGLEKTHFQVWEDKVQQEIRYFSAEEVPVSLGIVFDVSGSMAGKLPIARDAVTRLLKAGNPEDEYALIEFRDHPQVTQDFTSNIADFHNRLAFVSSSGWTALYDAVYLGIQKLRQGHNRRKALLLVTDGEDNHSRYTFDDVKELAKESDIRLFAIGIPGYPTLKLGSSMIDARKGSHYPGQDILQELVDLTGGQAFFTRDLRKLDDFCAKISDSLRNEYVIGYVPTNRAKDGKWRKLHLKVNDVSHVSVHARSGYNAPKE